MAGFRTILIKPCGSLSEEERERKQRLRKVFDDLRQVVPSLQFDKKATRAMILKKAADHIILMKKRNAAQWEDITALKRQNNDLEAELVELEKPGPKVVIEVVKEEVNEVIVIDSSDSESRQPIKMELPEESLEHFFSDSSDSEYGFSLMK